MQKSKLIAALRTLSNKEIKRFEAYILSPFFNKNENVIQLFHILRKYHPEFEESKVAMEAIFPKLFEGQPLDEQRLRYVMTDLFKLLEDFMSYLEYDKNEIYKKHLLLNAYDSRNLEKHFQQIMEDGNTQQKKQPYRNVNYFFNQHLLDLNAYLYSLVRKPTAINTSLQDAVDNLDLYYLSNRLRFSCAILMREDFFQEKYNNLLLDEILSFLSKTNLDATPAISIYYQITKMLLEADNPEHYQKLKALLAQYSQQFPNDEVYDMYTHALNYCNRKMVAGQLQYQEEMLELYKVLVEKEIIFDNGYITPNTFKNIVTLALRLDQVDYTQQFIHGYKEKITPEFRDSTYMYNMANLHYYRKEFGKALRTLQTVDLNDIYYHLDAKVLLLKTYYELDESEPFFSLVDAFTNYLKRNKIISDTKRVEYMNFVRYSKKLMQIRLGGRKSPSEIRDEILKLKRIVNLQWLSSKIEEAERVSA